MSDQIESNTSSRISSANSSFNSSTNYIKDFQIIQNWTLVKNGLMKTFGISKGKEADYSKLMTNQSAVTLSHGFQSVRNMEHSRDEVRMALYVPSSSNFISLDREYLHVWKSGLHIQKISIIPPGNIPKREDNRKKLLDGLWNVSKWIYIEKYHIYIVANQQLELKILDLHFETISVFSNPKPILW